MAVRLSFRQSLTVPYVVLVLTVAALIGWLSYRTGSQAINDMADRLLLETVHRISDTVEHHLMDSSAVLEAVFPEGLIPPENIIEADFNTLRIRFWTATSLHPDLNDNVYYGTREGQFFGLWRHSRAKGELRVKIAKEKTPCSLYQVNGIDGSLSDPVLEARGFDPRERPWYKASESVSAPVWTSIYISFHTVELMTTLARRVLDAKGALAGVVATDVTLYQLNDFIRTLEISEHALAFIVEPDGNLIASSRTPNTKKLADGQSIRLNVTDSGNPLQVVAFERVRQALAAAGAVMPQTLQVDDPTTGKGVQLAYNQFSKKVGLGWIVVVGVPRNVFIQGVTKNVMRTAIIASLAALVAIGIGLVILGWVSRDLKQLANAARQIGDGRLDTPLQIDRRDEIGELAISFRHMQRKLQTDTLTNLVNREGILKSINDRIHQHRRKADETPFAVYFIDLNNFKLVNDRLGHDAGDKVLVEIGERLQWSIRANDLVARYAGDEFVLLINDIDDFRSAQQIRRNLERVLLEPLRSVDITLLTGVTLGGAVGMAYYTGGITTAEALIKQADVDMYARKEGSKRIL